jgi:hypothetical protein
MNANLIKGLACTLTLVFVLAGSAAAVAGRTADVPLPGDAGHRFKEAPRNAPSRPETKGAFRIDAIADAFFIGDREHGHSVARLKRHT